MIKFNDQSIYVGQIKQMLKDFNLPTMKVYKQGQALCPESHYIKDNKIYYCNSNKELIEQELYIYNKSYSNLTTNLKINNLLYDTDTHKYLGNYLRFIRDYKGLNLMSMYNCFTKEQVGNNFYLMDEMTSSDKRYKIYMIPVKYYQKYTIGINCDLPITLAAGYYSADITDIIINSNNVNIYNEKDIRQQTIVSKASNYLFKPFVYTKLATYEPTDTQLKFESSLKLFIKVPVNCQSSIVVLEGDYTKAVTQYYGGLNPINPLDVSETPITIKWNNQIIYSDHKFKSELLSINNATCNALLATRLVEYLSENVINPTSESYDIEKVQRLLFKNRFIESEYLGVWSDQDTNAIYKIITNKKLNSKYYDVLPYVDKDTETCLNSIDAKRLEDLGLNPDEGGII